MKRFVQLAGGALLAMSSQMAHTSGLLAGHASIEFKNIMLAAIDLAPLDEITPSITFNGGSYVSYLEIGGYQIADPNGPILDGLLPGSGTQNHTSPQITAPLQVAIGNAQIGAFARVTPGATPHDPFDAVIRVDLALDDVSQVRADQAQVYLALLPDNISGTGSTLSLSPHTELRLTGQIEMHADFRASLTTGPTRGEAHYVAGWGVSLSGGTENYFAQDMIFLDFDRDHASEMLSMSITNDSDQAVDVGLAMTAMASTYAQIDQAPSVPEPYTPALALAGGAMVLAWRVRRHHA